MEGWAEIRRLHRAKVLQARGSRVADGVSAGRAGPVRPVVPAGGHAARVQPDRPAAGVGPGVRLFADDHGGDATVAAVTGSADFALTPALRLGTVPEGPGLEYDTAIGQWRGGKPQLTEAMNAFRGTLGIQVIQCPPADPETKAWSSESTATWRPRSCPALVHQPGRLQHPVPGLA